MKFYINKCFSYLQNSLRYIELDKLIPKDNLKYFSNSIRLLK